MDVSALWLGRLLKMWQSLIILQPVTVTRRFINKCSVACTVALFVAAACNTNTADGYSVTAGTLTISGVYLVAPIGDAPAAMYFSVQNTGVAPDTLTAIRVSGVEHAELHTEVMSNMPHETDSHMPHAAPSMTMMTMVPEHDVPVPPGGVLRLIPGGRHVMLIGVQRRFVRGDSTQADITFRHAGTVRVPVRVIDYAQLDTLV